MKKLLGAIAVLAGISASSLFAEDACLVFDGTDYLETDYYPGPETRLEVDFELADTAAQQFIVHAGGCEKRDLHVRVYVNAGGGYSWTFSDDQNFTPYVGPDGKPVRAEPGRRQIAVIDGFKAETAIGTPFGRWMVGKMETTRTAKTRSYPLRLFYNRYTDLRTKGRLYGLKIWERDVLLHDYKPVREGEETLLVDARTGTRLRTVESKNPFRTIVTKRGALKGVEGHVQGIACSDEAIYLSFTTTLVKLDWKGNVLKRVPARRHMGDISYREGRLYACLGRTKDPNEGLGGTAFIQIFDADLGFVGEKRTPSAPGIDGIGIWGDKIFVGGGSRECGLPHTRNLVVKLDNQLEPLASAWIDYGVRTVHGVQNVTVADGKVWCFLYTAEREDPGCVVLDEDLNLLKVVDFTAGNGVDALPPRFGKSKNPRFLVCRTLPSVDGTGVRAELRFVEICEAPVPIRSKR